MPREMLLAGTKVMSELLFLFFMLSECLICNQVIGIGAKLTMLREMLLEGNALDGNKAP